MLLMHPNTAALARLTSEDTLRRFATQGLHVVTAEDGYRIEATDCRMGAVVVGKNVDDPGQYPAIPALEAAPNGASEARGTPRKKRKQTSPPRIQKPQLDLL